MKPVSSTIPFVLVFLALSILLLPCMVAVAAPPYETDTFETSVGTLAITFIGHSTLMLTAGETVIHVDPWSDVADYATLPDADIVLITHDHRDHLDPNALAEIVTGNTTIIYSEKCSTSYPGGTVLQNGDTFTVRDINIKAVPAYNIPHEGRRVAHPEGECNGYIITVGGTNIYITSETDNIVELSYIKDIDILFIAMDGRNSMSPEDAVDAVRKIGPRVVYPYHYALADLSPFVSPFQNDWKIDVRLRDLGYYGFVRNWDYDEVNRIFHGIRHFLDNDSDYELWARNTKTSIVKSWLNFIKTMPSSNDDDLNNIAYILINHKEYIYTEDLNLVDDFPLLNEKLFQSH